MPGCGHFPIWTQTLWALQITFYKKTMRRLNVCEAITLSYRRQNLNNLTGRRWFYVMNVAAAKWLLCLLINGRRWAGYIISESLNTVQQRAKANLICILQHILRQKAKDNLSYILQHFLLPAVMCLTVIFQWHWPGGRDCFSFSAFSLSVMTSVYRYLLQRTLNLTLSLFFLIFTAADRKGVRV